MFSSLREMHPAGKPTDCKSRTYKFVGGLSEAERAKDFTQEAVCVERLK
jgi:hypothetical protein